MTTISPTSGGFPRPPAHLNSFGKRKWKELYPVLEAADRIAEADLTTFEALCFHYGLYRETWRAIYRPLGPDGKRRRRTLEEYLDGKNSQNAPELTVMRESLKEFEKLMSEFGRRGWSRRK
jgi:P27 family predicted phage terminase small subunit